MNAGPGISIAAAGRRQIAIWSLLVTAVTPGAADTVLKPGAISELRVEMPMELRIFAGDGKPSPVTSVQVAISVPGSFDPSRVWPVMVVSATSDPGYNSSRALMRRYSQAATDAGWILVAADPLERVSMEDDSLRLRYVMVSIALLELGRLWPLGTDAPLAFGGFSGGAKHSGVLAAEFAARNRFAIGVFQSGINSETLALVGKELNVMTDAYRRIPVFLAGGKRDKIATPAAHREVAATLKNAGFNRVRLEFGEGGHETDPAMLEVALKWFSELSRGQVDGG